MVLKLVTTFSVLLVTMVSWLGVQALYRQFAKNNPECGPFREDGGNSACKCCASRQHCIQASS